MMRNEMAKEHSRRAFDRRAIGYESTLAGWHSQKMKSAAFRHLGEPLRGSLLDVGCGPGILLATLLEEKPDLSLAGIDLAPEMIRVAKERLGARADLRVGDSERLPWNDGFFDAVTCIDSFHHYPAPGRVLAEMHRVLRRGGQLVIADPSAPPVIRQIANLLNPLLRRGDVKMYAQREMTQMLGAAGFEQSGWTKEGSYGFVVTAVAI